MKTMKFSNCGIMIVLLVGESAVYAGSPLGTAFTYQGQIKQGGVPLSATTDFQFSLHDSLSGVSLIGGPLTRHNVDVVNGLFTVSDLDFGQEVFGNAAWLEIEVRTPAWDGAGAEPPFTVLSPRQAITAAPFALQTRGMFVNDAGDIGIGTATPQASLDVTNPGGQTAIRAMSSWIGVFGSHNSTSGTFPGVWGETDSLSNNATALRGIVTSTTPGSNSAGVLGKNNGTGSNGIGVKGVHDGDGTGVRGEVAGANGFAGLFEGGRTRVSSTSGGTLELVSPEFPTLGSNFTLGSVDFIDGTNTAKASVAVRHTFFGDRLEFSLAGEQRVHIDGLGRMGIGTPLNAAQLHVNDASDAEPGSGGIVVIGDVASSNLAMDANEIMARNNGATSTLYLNNDGGDVSLIANESGSVGIGIANMANVPAGVLLAVDGKVLCEEVEVQLSQDWPDFVFDDDYELMPLAELGRKIRLEKHLPGFPAAEAVESHGLALGAMQARLVQKVEELTLYVIQLDRELDAMKTENEILRWDSAAMKEASKKRDQISQRPHHRRSFQP